MKEMYTSPVVEIVSFASREPVAGVSLDFGDFFTKSISNELSLTEDNAYSDA